MTVTMGYDWNGGMLLGADGDIKNNYGCLEDRHADNLFDQIVFGQHGIEANHHE